MRDTGILPEDRVEICVTSQPQLIVSFLATQHLSATAVFLDTSSDNHPLLEYLKLFNLQAVICHE
ncbi:hypothetical protein [Coxiella-like endosymbiont]|uniref:hypothetical protein n=1 Tax=Coxiella-like endosymbiont TaxID=1592897 RepID=UPI002729E6DF|nr:hypothetical protein [Coxiella-like endosymbiont]